VEARFRPAAQGRERDLLDWVRLLADEVGPRRPTGPGERRAAELVADRLRGAGVEARLESFRGYSSFAASYGAIAAAALAPALLSRRRRLLRAIPSLAAVAALVSEGGLVRTPLSDALSTRESRNLVATIEPSGESLRTACLLCHLDTSRSGLLFHPAAVRLLNPWLKLQAAATIAQAADPLLTGSRPGRALVAVARAIIAAGAALLAERELRGSDVPGANDNASGVAVVASLATELAERPLDRTRVVALMTGCEEAGVLGAQAFLRGRDTRGWLFVNVDNVGGAVPLRYLRSEGLVAKWPADPALAAIAARLAAERLEFELSANAGPIGLTYDATPVLARGGRAITFVAAADDGVIPNYHWPTDTADNVDPAAIARARGAVREMLGAIDRGEADRVAPSADA